MNKNLRIDIESIYNKDYQNDTYRARIIDENNKVLIRGSRIFSREEEAYEDGENLLKILDRRAAGLDFTNKKWIGPFHGLKHYDNQKFYLIISLSVALGIVVIFTILLKILDEYYFTLILGLLCLLCVLMLPLVPFIAVYICREGYIFMLDDDILYAVCLINDDPISTTGIFMVDAINNNSHCQTDSAIRSIYSVAKNIDDFTRFHVKSRIYEITDVISIKEYRKKKYKVKCIAKKYSGDKKNK